MRDHDVWESPGERVVAYRHAAFVSADKSRKECAPRSNNPVRCRTEPQCSISNSLFCAQNHGLPDL
jgi:hypothetical protein